MVLDDQLKNLPMQYRSKLTIPKNVNFGLELELDKVDFMEVRRLVSRYIGGDWNVRVDNSLTKLNNAEINSPVLYNNKSTWELLIKMSELLKQINPSYDICSFQINFDGFFLPKEKDRKKALTEFEKYRIKQEKL